MLKTYVKAKALLSSLRDDKEGATIIEYSLLVGLITVLAVVTIILMGTWVSNQWIALEAAVNP